MDQQSQKFVPRSRIGTLIAFFNHHLTLVSVTAVVIGLVLTLIGPVRAVLAGRASLAGDADAPVASQSQAALWADSGSEAQADTEGLSRSLSPYTIIPDRPRDHVITYTVQPGDSLLAIADTFDLEPNTLFWANSEKLGDSVHMLHTGLDLFILPVNGVYHKSDGEHTLRWVAEHYSANIDDILSSPYNELDSYTPDDILPWGMRIVVPGGSREIVDWRPPIVETTDTNTGRVSRAFMPGMGGSCASGIAGSGGTGAWISPLSSYVFTQSFYPGHSGVDLAANMGTPVMAADSGTVIFAGWVLSDWGYGMLIVLDHGNGWTTYYAHLSGIAVSCGQFVQGGQYIGQVGETGNSRGSHLHFEMRWGHIPDNPANYIAF